MRRRRPDQVNCYDVATHRSFSYREIPASYVTGLPVETVRLHRASLAVFLFGRFFYFS